MNGPVQNILGPIFMLKPLTTNDHTKPSFHWWHVLFFLLQDSGKLNFRNTSMQAEEVKDFTEQEMKI
jgi:hypothetical protein